MQTKTINAVSKTKRAQAEVMAKAEGQNVVIFAVINNGIQMLATEQQYDESPNKDEVEVLEVISPEGKNIK